MATRRRGRYGRRTQTMPTVNGTTGTTGMTGTSQNEDKYSDTYGFKPYTPLAVPVVVNLYGHY